MLVLICASAHLSLGK